MNSKWVNVSKAPSADADDDCTIDDCDADMDCVDDDEDDKAIEVDEIAWLLVTITSPVAAVLVVVSKSLDASSALLRKLLTLVDRPGNHDTIGRRPEVMIGCREDKLNGVELVFMSGGEWIIRGR